MKRIIVSVLLLVGLVMLSSCAVFSFGTVTLTDPKDYGRVWELNSMGIGERSRLFPESTDGLEVEGFCCVRTYYLFSNYADWQVLLTARFDRAGFETETERLKDLCRDSYIRGETEYFDLPAFASVWNYGETFEYALVKEDELTVCYVYIEGTPADEISVSSLPLPKGYDMRMSGPGFSLYPPK